MGQVVGLTTTPGPIWWKSRGEIRYAPGYEVESTVRGPPPGCVRLVASQGWLSYECGALVVVCIWVLGVLC